MTEENESEKIILQSLQRRRSPEKPDDLVERTIKIKKKHWSVLKRVIKMLNGQ